MIVTMTLELSDKPGQLLSALEPIAEHGGNIVSVNHQRGDTTPRGTLPVEITFEILEEKFDDVIGDLRDMGVTLAEIGEEKLHESVTVVLVGHIVREDITDTVRKVEETESERREEGEEQDEDETRDEKQDEDRSDESKRQDEDEKQDEKQDERPGVKIVDFSISMPEDVNETSSARLMIKATDEDVLERALDSIEEICDEKGFVMMDPIEVV